MSALRQRAALMARRSRPSNARGNRSYASDSHGHHDHHPPHNVEEHFGPGFYLTLAAIPTSMLVYNIAQPSADGESKSFTKLLAKWSDSNAEWERINTLHTAAVEQAAHDKHLFYYPNSPRHVELRFPEVFSTGSPHNIPAGHAANLDHVVAHYRKKHLDEEERKAKRIAAANKEE